MTPCLLCPSPAVADALCVPCGAKLRAATDWQRDPVDPLKLLFPRTGERAKAIFEINTLSKASDFLARLEAAKAERLRKEGA